MTESEQFDKVPEREGDAVTPTSESSSDLVHAAREGEFANPIEQNDERSSDERANPMAQEGVAAAESVVAEPTAIPPVRPSHADTLHKIFVGPNGIRAGWRLLIYFVVLFVFSSAMRPLIRRLLGPMRPGQSLAPERMFWIELIPLAITVAAVLVMMFIERRPWREYGLPLQRAFRGEFWFGCLWGFLGLSAVLGVLRLAGAFYLDGLELHGGAIAKYALAWGAVFLLVGVFEEFSVRGYLLYTLASGIRFWPAAVLTSSLFLVGHVRNAGENWFGLADVFVIGTFFCFTLWRTGNLWFAVGLHASWDWGQSYFYSVPDSGMIAPGHLFHMHTQGPAWLSGGSVGPEGSVVSLASHLVYFAVFALIYKRREWLPKHLPSLRPAAAEAD